jgi:hypothetical protein
MAALFEREMARRLVDAAPVGKTGDTRRSIVVRLKTRTPRNTMVQQLAWRAEVRVPYASFVHDGTRPHTIVPVRAAALAFFWQKLGRFVFFMKVHHPGNAPNPWFRDTLAKTTQLLGSLWRRV